MSSSLGAVGVREQRTQSFFLCFSHAFQPIAVEGNTAEEEERQNNSTKQGNYWKKLLQPSSLNFLCVESSKVKAGVTVRNAAATALQEIKLQHNFSY